MSVSFQPSGKRASLVTAKPPCDRCGTFTPEVELQRGFGQRLCPTCRLVRLAAVRLWTRDFILLVGTLMIPVGWVLAAIDWWRLGDRRRALGLPFASLVSWLVLMRWAPAPALRLTFLSVFHWALILMVNGASIWIATSELDRPLEEQRAAGGMTANRWVPLGSALLPVSCLMGYLLRVG